MLRWRLLLGTLLIAAVIALSWMDYRAAVAGSWLGPVAALLAILATQETLAIVSADGVRPARWVVYLGNLFLVGSNWLPLMADHSTAPETWLLLTLALSVFAVLVAEMRRYEKPGGVTASIAAATFALVYVGVLLSFVVQLRLVWGIGALAALVIVVKMADTGAYTVGRLIGRHKMAPILSPGKTWEGLAGGLAFALGGSYATFRWLVPNLPTVPPNCIQYNPWWGWVAFGLLVGIAGMSGDLAESLLKRDTGRKDSSTWMPGFGGVLDVLDSVLLGGPIAYLCWRLGMVGGAG